jgi:hypothetical protein
MSIFPRLSSLDKFQLKSHHISKSVLSYGTASFNFPFDKTSYTSHQYMYAE